MRFESKFFRGFKFVRFLGFLDESRFRFRYLRLDFDGFFEFWVKKI